VGLSDAISSAVETTTGHAGAVGAALATLAQEPGLSIEQLRVPLGRTQSATVRVVDQLVAEGHAERRPGRDQRSIAVVLTPHGTEAAARVLASRERALRDAVGVLAPGERRALTSALEKVLARITRAGPMPTRSAACATWPHARSPPAPSNWPPATGNARFPAAPRRK